MPGMTAGPLIGGVLAGFGGTEVAMLVNAASFGVVALAALVLTARRPRPHARARHERRVRDAAVHGGLRDGRGLFLKEDLDVSDAVYGLVFAAWTIRTVVGALVVARRVRRPALALGVLVAVLAQGVGLGLPTAWLVVPFGAAMWFIGRVGHGTKNTLARTLIQERVPDRLHGRAFAAYNGMRNGAELVALGCGGLLVSAIAG